MKIVAVTSHNILTDSSGTPKHILKIASEIAERGHEIILFHLKFTFGFKVVKQKSDRGIIVYEIPFLYWLFGSLKLIKDFQPQVCMAFTNGAACRFIPVIAISHLPLVYEIHTVFKHSSIFSPRAFIYEQLEKIVCYYARHLIVLGNKVKEMYVDYRQVKEQNISIIYPSVSLKEFAREESVKDPEKSITVTYLGNLIYVNHGIDFLLDAAKIVCAKTDNINFILAGEPEGADEYYQQDLTDLKERVKFVYLKSSSQVSQVMAEADILAHTRINSLDNLSIQSKLAVYMATGKPIIATNFADYQYLIQERECGYAVDLKPQSIAEAILNLANNPDLRKEMGKNSRDTASKYFNLDTTVDKYLDILETVS
jgi:glycosyltransferase involved in cell wall biosynthesis